MDNNKNFKLEGGGLVKNPVKRFGTYQHIVLKDCVCVETSYDGGSTWKCNCKRNKTDGQVGTFRWNVPNTTFKNCCMRITCSESQNLAEIFDRIWELRFGQQPVKARHLFTASIYTLDV